MRTAVITIVRGRHSHLRMHVRGLASDATTPYSHFIVAMGDSAVKTIVAQEESAARTIEIDAPAGSALPLARARNIGAAEALRQGAELLVFLDVDCIAAPLLLTRYLEAARSEGSTPALFCGPVTYLPHPVADSTSSDSLALLHNPHPARPAPPDGKIVDGNDFDLFWSLSFALTATTWRALGGFCEDYLGYGGEDTDFARAARGKGVKLTWVGGADAYHQFHPVSDPPVEHLDDILINARVFHRRWGEWPMQGWIDAFESAGLIAYQPDSGHWERVRPSVV
ncbi:glycosyltransferase family 2 protein [Rhodococcus qingshengii]|uniref:glycosyltransferase family 2 protein n=1 Tax=Rhodococcus TaxID=1827 RepID=UPI001BAC30EA|nr:hypothetical protein [Rhodococcus qingshengii]